MAFLPSSITLSPLPWPLPPPAPPRPSPPHRPPPPTHMLSQLQLPLQVLSVPMVIAVIALMPGVPPCIQLPAQTRNLEVLVHPLTPFHQCSPAVALTGAPHPPLWATGDPQLETSIALYETPPMAPPELPLAVPFGARHTIPRTAPLGIPTTALRMAPHGTPSTAPPLLSPWFLALLLSYRLASTPPPDHPVDHLLLL